jgi:hypothetical protein
LCRRDAQTSTRDGCYQSLITSHESLGVTAWDADAGWAVASVSL